MAARGGEPGGAELRVLPIVNGDGLNDVVASLEAHGWGLAWFEQKRDASKNISLVPAHDHGQLYDEECWRRDVYRAARLDTADINGDGIQDIVTGKRCSRTSTLYDPDP